MPVIDWRRKFIYSPRCQEIEAKANDLLAIHESEHGSLGDCVVKVELLLPTIGCDMVYYSDEERREHQIPEDAIGVLKPEQRLVFIYDDIRNLGRENQTIGEEVGHFVLHLQGVGQGDKDSQKKDIIFCRLPENSYLNGTVEPIWMSTEASFFSACLQMPRDRYGPIAREILVKTLQARPYHYVHWRSLTEKINQLQAFASRESNSNDPGKVVLERASNLLDTNLVEDALVKLEYRHHGLVSKNAQRRRLFELGLIVDVADVFEDRLGKSDVPRFMQFMLSDSIIHEAVGK